MIKKNGPCRWVPYENVPYAVKENVMYIGKGENTLTFDLDKLQHDVETVIHVCQDESGTLHGYIDIAGEVPPNCVARIIIPPGYYEVYDTGETQKNATTGKDEPVMARRKITVDADNCTIERNGCFFPILAADEKKEEE